jgi:pSer/pThr/pTyr-binding forkhead associated (FHA) protein
VGTATRPTEGVAGIRFIIPASGRRITLPLQDQIQIGRLDLQRGIQPDLDVSADSDPTAGVSRLHASIVRTPQGIAIMDLHSANGTRVNGFHIPPDLPYALNSGDELKLGDLLIHVLFEG